VELNNSRVKGKNAGENGGEKPAKSMPDKIL